MNTTVYEVLVAIPSPAPQLRDTEVMCQHLAELNVAEAVHRCGNPLLADAVVGGICTGVAVYVGLPKLVRISSLGGWHYPADMTLRECEDEGPDFASLVRFVASKGGAK